MPVSRAGAATALVKDREFVLPDRVFVVGGVDEKGDIKGDVLKHDTLKDTWEFVFQRDSKEDEIITQADESPAELLTRAFSAYVEIENTLYMFGGIGKDNQELDDIVKVEFKADDTFTVKRLDVKLPAGVRDSSAAILSQSSTTTTGFEAAANQTVRILIFGGLSGGRETNDTFIFTDTVEIAAPPPPPEECTGGPTVKSISVGGETKVKGNGFLDGLTLTVNGIAFTKSPSVTPNKVTQKGPLANGQTAQEACAGGCEFIIKNGDGKCTKVSVP